jgi:hypothetical protein
VLDKCGGLNGSTQYLLVVYLQQFHKPKSFASIDSNATPFCLGLVEYSLTDRFCRGSLLGSTDLMVLHRPVELASINGKVKKITSPATGFFLTFQPV